MPLSDDLRAAYPEDALALAVSGGEDYELLITGDEKTVERVGDGDQRDADSHRPDGGVARAPAAAGRQGRQRACRSGSRLGPSALRMTAVLTFDSDSVEETRRLGERMGALLSAGDVVLLSGELGAGKTVFVQGIARGLGFEGSVSSKSFVLLGEYPGRVTLYHADLYRLEAPEEVAELALDEISADGVLVVEWPERAGDGRSAGGARAGGVRGDGRGNADRCGYRGRERGPVSLWPRLRD